MSGTAAEDDDDDIDEAINGAWVNVPSAFSWDGSSLRGGGATKTGGSVGNTVGGIGVTAAQFATHNSSLAVAGAVAAGAAVSATGLGEPRVWFDGGAPAAQYASGSDLTGTRRSRCTTDRNAFVVPRWSVGVRV
jgi:hypothetical protein